MTESAGARLKNLRLQKGLSLEEAHRKTKIHPNILKAIEEESLLNFSPVYIKGFLKIYCQLLGVDPKDYLPDYKEPNNVIRYAPVVKDKAPLTLKMSSLKNLAMKATQIKLNAVMAVVLILVIIFGLFNLGKFVSSRPGSRQVKAVEVPVVIQHKTEASVATAKLPPAPVVKTITLDVRAQENCFMSVKADDRVVFQNILKKGRSESWQAKEKIELSLANAAAVELEVNGKRISGLGRRGQALKNVLINKEGLSLKR